MSIANRYLVIKWIPPRPGTYAGIWDEPGFIYSEIDSEGWELRKIEYFDNDEVGFADATHHTARTKLGLVAISLEEEQSMDESPEFEIHYTTPEDFEARWILATKDRAI